MSWLDKLLSLAVQSNGSQVGQRQTVNFTGAIVTDDPANDRITVAISAVGSAIEQLTGDVTAIGPGIATATVQKINGVTLANAAAAGKVLYATSSSSASWTTLNGSIVALDAPGPIGSTTPNSGSFTTLSFGTTGAPTSPTIQSGNGSPEGVVTAIVGSLYSDKVAAGGTALYAKITGSSSTGWLAVGNFTAGGDLSGTSTSQTVAKLNSQTASAYIKTDASKNVTSVTTIPLADIANSGGALGDGVYWNGANWVRLALGSTGQYYKAGALAPAWSSGIPLADLQNSGGAAGDTAYWNGSNWVKLSLGSTGQYYKAGASAPSWSSGIPLADLQNAGGAIGDIAYWNGSNWTRLPAGASSYLLTSGGVGVAPSWQVAPSGFTAGGDLSGSSTSQTVAKLLSQTANAYVKTDASKNVTTSQTIPLADIANSGGAIGDIAYWNGSNWVRLAAGASTYVLTSNGAGVAPSWQAGGGGGGAVSGVTKTFANSPYTASNSDTYISYDPSGGNSTVLLPASPSAWQSHEVKHASTSANKVTINGNGKTIDGAASIDLRSYDCAKFVYNGTAWEIH